MSILASMFKCFSNEIAVEKKVITAENFNFGYMIGMYLDHAKQIADKLGINIDVVNETNLFIETPPTMIFAILENDKIVLIRDRKIIYTTFSSYENTPIRLKIDWNFIIGKNYQSASGYLSKYHPDIEFTFIPPNYNRGDYFEKAVYLRYNKYGNISEIIRSNV